MRRRLSASGSSLATVTRSRLKFLVPWSGEGAEFSATGKKAFFECDDEGRDEYFFEPDDGPGVVLRVPALDAPKEERRAAGVWVDAFEVLIIWTSGT